MLGRETFPLDSQILGTPAAAGAALTATGDKFVFPAPCRCEVLMVGLLITTACAGADATPVVKFDKRPTAGSDTNRGDGDLGAFDLGTQAAGKLVYFKPDTRITLEPGQEVLMEVTTAAAGSGAAGAGRPVIMVRAREEQPANLVGMVEGTPPS